MHTVLMVEDNEAIRNLNSRILHYAGYTVISHITAFDALNTLDTQNYDVAILDIQMPGMDGLELLRRIRSHPVYANLPVIVLTAGLDSTIGRSCRELGADIILEKPISVQTLCDSVKSLLVVAV